MFFKSLIIFQKINSKLFKKYLTCIWVNDVDGDDDDDDDDELSTRLAINI